MILSHELNPHPTYTWLVNFILQIYIASTMNSFSHHCIITTTSSSLYQLGYQFAQALSRVEVLRIIDYLQTNAFPTWWWWSKRGPLTFYKGKPLREATSEVVRETAGQTRLGLTLGTSTSTSTRLSWRQSYIAADVLQ